MACYPGLKPESVIRTVEPDLSSLPVSIEEAKSRSYVSGTREDEKFQGFILSAIDYCEKYQWSQLMTATHVMRLERFQSVIELWPNPVQSVTTVQYVDVGGTTQTLTVSTDYVTDVYSKPARVVPAYTKWWPATRGHINDVIVTYQTGFASADLVPATTKQAIFMLVSHWYQNREATGTATGEVEFSVKSLLDLTSYRTFF